MVNYLEQSLERTEALMEEVRRLERGLSAVKAPPEGEAPPSHAEEEREPGKTGREAGAGLLLAGISGPLPSYEGGRSDASPERTGEPEPPERTPTSLEERENQADSPEKPGTPALLRQTKQLERAAAVSAGDGFLRRQAGAESSGSYPASRPGSRATVPPGAAVGAGSGQNAVLPGVLSADEVRWAERADRVFRRDSRRYDGGFYLY